MSLLILPNELLLLIASSLREAEINAFSRTNHLFHNALTPYLYERNAKCFASALTWAARRGLLSTARRAFDAGAQVSLITTHCNDQTSLLIEAAYGGFTEVFNLILDHIPPKDLKYALSITLGLTRSTPLYLAARDGHTEIVRIIVERCIDMDPNFPDRYGRTPLFMACAGRHAAAVDALLMHPKIDPNKSDGSSTPLFTAVRRKNTRIVAALLAHGAHADQKDTYDEQTPLHTAVLNKQYERVRLLTGTENLNPNSLSHGKTPLQYAVQANDEDIAELLLSDKRTIPDLTVLPTVQNPLLEALLNNNEKMAQLLLNAGANPHICDQKGLSPAILMEAPTAEARRALLQRYSTSSPRM